MAAGDAVRTLLARFTADSSPLERNARQMQTSGRRLGDNLSSGFERGTRRIGQITRTVLGFALVREGVNAVKGVFSSLGDEAREAQKAGGQTAAVIASMGASSWTSKSQIEALSEALSNKHAVDDELIQSGANVLLTFGKVRNEVGQGNDVFNRAVTSAHNMSVALGTDMNAASIQVGKALNDPIKGLTALGRAGVSFTQQQRDQVKAMVEAGDTLGAQKLILAELDNQFRGSAAAQATAGDRIRVVMANLAESIGGKLMPYVDQFLTFMSVTGIPVLSAFASTVGARVQPYLDRFGAWLQGVGLPAAQAFGSWLMQNVVPVVLELGQAFSQHVLPRLLQFGSFLVGTVIPALGQMFTWMNQNRGAIVTVAAVLLSLVAAQKAHTAAMAVARAGGMVAFLTNLAKSTAIVSAATKTWTALQWLLNIALNANPIGIVIGALALLGAALYLAWTKSETFRNIVTGAWNSIRSGVTAAWGWIRDRAIDPLVAAFSNVRSRATALKDGVVRTFNGMRDSVGKAFGELKGKILAPVASVIRWINSNLIGNINKVTEKFGLTIRDIPVPRYHKGGYVRGRDGAEVPAVLQAGETVISRQRTRELRRRLGTTGSGLADLLHGRRRDPKASMPHGGFIDWISDAASSVGSQIGDWLKEGAAFAMDKLMSPAVGAIASAADRAGAPDYFVDLFRGVARKWKESAVAWARGKDTLTADTAKGVGGPGGAIAKTGWAKPIGPGYRIGRGSRGHGYLAQDLPAPTGTPIYAMHGGRVIRARDLTTSYGRHVFIQHPGTVGVYAHMSQRYAGMANQVRAGQMIGRVGSTGNSTGPHLHLETRGFDPLTFLRARGIRFDHGGVVAPGQTVINNQTGGYEHLLNAAELPSLLSGLSVHVYVGDREITDIVRTEVRTERKKDDQDLFDMGVH